jgi:hypothetical protein
VLLPLVLQFSACSVGPTGMQLQDKLLLLLLMVNSQWQNRCSPPAACAVPAVKILQPIYVCYVSLSLGP